MMALDYNPPQFTGSLPSQGDNLLSPLPSQGSAYAPHAQSLGTYNESSAFANLFPFGIDMSLAGGMPAQFDECLKVDPGEETRLDVFNESDRANSDKINTLTKTEDPDTGKAAERSRPKPVSLEELTHDNSRFAKVVKAFLSIDDEENRTVPEIAKKVGELYSGQYADFETVKVSRDLSLRVQRKAH